MAERIMLAAAGIVLMLVGVVGLVSSLIRDTNRTTLACYEDAEAIMLNDGEQWCANYDDLYRIKEVR